ncbi:Bll4978 protein [alpha proteobacterium U9-1i]|nr:Bll4978 protein [alpha proteobacterium U9-1i]
MSDREFDVIVYGATGFTGRLVAEYLLSRYGAGGDVKWAMAGRDAAKLETIRAELGAPASLPLVTANANDAASIDAMAKRAKVVLTTVGPYQLYGEALVAACARTGTDYVDLCGEPAWMAAMIQKYEAAAKQSGARIVFSCGFDSIPFDGGVFFLQQEAQKRFGAPLPRVRGRVRKMKGTFSGGTMASMLATLEAGERDPSVPASMRNPYALVADPPKTRQPHGQAVQHDADIPTWSAPFVMAAINTKNVHRTNALLGYPYGRDFTYDEMQATGDGPEGERRAIAAMRQSRTQMTLLGIPFTRSLLRRFALPKPGQGPNKHERETGLYEVLFVGDAPDGRALRAVVKGDRDPGYGSTSKIISEAALCLKDTPRTQTAGGIWTASAAMGSPLLTRLHERAGLTFALEN